MNTQSQYITGHEGYNSLDMIEAILDSLFPSSATTYEPPSVVQHKSSDLSSYYINLYEETNGVDDAVSSSRSKVVQNQ